MNRNYYVSGLVLFALGCGSVVQGLEPSAAPIENEKVMEASEAQGDAETGTQTEAQTEAVVEGAETEMKAEVEEKGTLVERASYGIGLNFGRNLQRQGADFDLDKVMTGLRDGLEGNEAWLNDEEIRASMQEMQKQWMEAQRKDREELGTKNEEEGAAFLAENGAREGVVTTESGLQYEVIEEGDGAIPMSEDRVEVHYTGTLLDGTVFDSSHDRGQPAKFGVTRVISGWTEALQMMTVGSKWKLYIPSDLAYGERGAGANIGPNATLTFEVELLGIEEPPAVQTAPVEPDEPAESDASEESTE